MQLGTSPRMHHVRDANCYNRPTIDCTLSRLPYLHCTRHTTQRRVWCIRACGASSRVSCVAGPYMQLCTFQSRRGYWSICSDEILWNKELKYVLQCARAWLNTHVYTQCTHTHAVMHHTCTCTHARMHTRRHAHTRIHKHALFPAHAHTVYA